MRNSFPTVTGIEIRETVQIYAGLVPYYTGAVAQFLKSVVY
jgi:hypothetical protein